MRQFFLVLLLISGSVAGEQLEEVVVTGSRLDSYSGMPAISLTKPADFLVQEIRLINDSRSPELRKQEILTTINKLLSSAEKAQNVALSYGDGFLLPISLNDETLQIIEDQKRPDTSSVDIYVKVTLVAGSNTKQSIQELRKFIEKAELVGRTEVELLRDVGLSIVNPEKYRHAIIEKIAEENKRLLKTMGAQCQVKVAGLEARVEWERTAVAELTLFIPYSVELSNCTHSL